MKKKPRWITPTIFIEKSVYYREHRPFIVLHEKEAGQHMCLPKVIWFFMRQACETKLGKDKNV